MVCISEEYCELGFKPEVFPRTYQFLESQRIRAFERLPSRWKSQNLVLRTCCEWEDYVVKKINRGAEGEIEKVKLFRRSYPQITPPLFIVEGIDCYTMGYIGGRSFFNLKKSEKVEKIAIAGRELSMAYSAKGNGKIKDISAHVRKGFERYREKRKEYFENEELRLSEKEFELFRQVPDQPSHNDLNAANLLYNHGIKLIDPSEEGYDDIARDVGRYCASCFFNNYDCFGQDKEHSIEIARAFLQAFDPETLRRAKYYIGESFLSFLGFNTETTDKKVLKKLAVNMLTGDGDIMKVLQTL